MKMKLRKGGEKMANNFAIAEVCQVYFKEAFKSYRTKERAHKSALRACKSETIDTPKPDTQRNTALEKETRLTLNQTYKSIGSQVSMHSQRAQAILERDPVVKGVWWAVYRIWEKLWPPSTFALTQEGGISLAWKKLDDTARYHWLRLCAPHMKMPECPFIYDADSSKSRSDQVTSHQACVCNKLYLGRAVLSACVFS
jgi:hypothetical protein